MDSINTQSELKKEIEKQIEKEKLKNVIELIRKEIIDYLTKKKNVSEFLLNYRKKYIEEYRDDEDKLMEYFDHESFVKEETYKSIDRRLKELTILQKAPYFGRVDFKEASTDEIENIYIGRFGMTPEDTYVPIVIDWRAPVSSLFYNNGLGRCSYNSPMGEIKAEIFMKRQYIVKNGDLKGLFDSALDVKDDILQLVLSQHSSAKLKDVIMTIQAEQDNIIRQPRDKVIVVNGTAGSGKTTIALHRVAYLLYNYRDYLSDKVLIFGPNNIFMDYISRVLPELGEIGVFQTTFRDFAFEQMDVPNIMSFKDYMEKVLSGDKSFIHAILHKNSDKYINFLDIKIKELDENYFNVQEVKFNNQVIVSKVEIKELFNHYYKDMPIFRRSNKVKRIIFLKIKDKRDEIVRSIEKDYKEAISKLSGEKLEEEKNQLYYSRKLRIRETIEQVIEAKKSLTWLINPDSLEIYKQIINENELTIDDLAPVMYLKIKLEGLKLKREIKHVVIDEAQDYSAIQFKVIQELTGCKSFTIVGDSNQRLIPLQGDLPLLHLEDYLSNVNIENFDLLKSYRSTKEITEYSNKFLDEKRVIPMVRNGEDVVEKSFSNISDMCSCIITTIENLKSKDYESIAILCKNLDEVKTLKQNVIDNNTIKIFDKEELLYKAGTVLVPSYFAKGMEFDAVIMIDFEDSYKDDRMKYVMATRALHELFVFHTPSKIRI